MKPYNDLRVGQVCLYGEKQVVVRKLAHACRDVVWISAKDAKHDPWGEQWTAINVKELRSFVDT